MSDGPSMAGRALQALLLMIGFYLLALAIAGALIAIPIMEMAVANRLHLKLVVLCGAGAIAILWGIMPRWDRFEAPGPELSPEQHPRLFEVLRGVASATNQAMPVHVYLVGDVNAWVTERGGIMGLGSKRVMGLGLPLMQVLSVSQLRAVIAHEFGHFYGGDTKLGPWVYKTRSAIVRTLASLGDDRPILQKPFLWYGNMFLRITHAVSRHQEFAADALAARTVGGKFMTEGLKIIHGASLSFSAYWNDDYRPVLGAGVLPPLAKGFGHFVSSRNVQEAVEKATAKAMEEWKTNPYDTHPSLPERTQALAGLPPGPHEEESSPSIALLEDVSKLEHKLFETILREDFLAKAKALEWEEVPGQVFVPGWVVLAKKGRNWLEGLTLGSLPGMLTNFESFAKTVNPDIPREGIPEDEFRRNWTMSLLGAATCVALNSRGWTLTGLPGQPIAFKHNGVEFQPFHELVAMVTDEAARTTWTEKCERSGVASLPLAPDE